MGFKISYAQNREDYIIEAFFKDLKNGFYVDIGANDPNKDSVTKIFYDMGWSGINIEPLKSKYNSLQKERPRDTNLNFGVSDKNSTEIFREYIGDGISTFSKQMKESYDSNGNPNSKSWEDYSVEVHTLADIFNKNVAKKINFMKIDVEGYEFEVISGNDWKKYRPELLCVESNHINSSDDWRSLLVDNDYTLVFNDGLNDYFLEKNSMFRFSQFDYPDSLLTGDQIIKWTVKNDIDLIESNYEDNIKQLHNHIDNLEKKQKKSKLDYKTLQAEYNKSQEFKNLLRALLKEIKNKLSK